MKWLAVAALAVGLLARPALADTTWKGVSAQNEPVTRAEFVQAAANWVHAYEKLSHRSLKNPKETILIYLDLNDGSIRDTALDLEKNYRLFEGVEDFQYGLFEPSQPMTRLQAAQILRNVVDLVESAKKVTVATPKEFQDKVLDPDDQKVIDELSSRNIFYGFRDTTFKPGQKLDHRQFEMLQANFLHYLDTTVQKP